MKHAHEIKTRILLPMFTFYMYDEEEEEEEGKERDEARYKRREQRERCFSLMCIAMSLVPLK